MTRVLRRDTDEEEEKTREDRGRGEDEVAAGQGATGTADSGRGGGPSRRSRPPALRLWALGFQSREGISVGCFSPQLTVSAATGNQHSPKTLVMID